MPVWWCFDIETEKAIWTFARLAGQCEAVDEGVGGVVVWAQEVAPLGAASGYHVVTAGHDLARECHA